MEKRARWVLAGTAVLLLVMLLWHSGKQDELPVSVQTADVTVRDIYNIITMSGEVEASETTALCPAKDAVVSGSYVAIGDTVAQGDVLCTLQPGAAAASLQQAAQAVLNVWGEGQVQTAQAGEDTVLRAPVSGTVLSLPKTGENVYAGVPCVRIADLNSLQVRAQCPELYAGHLQTGQQANVTVAALSDAVFGATVQSLSPVAVHAISLAGSSSEATVEALLSISGATDGLRPGYSTTVKIFTDCHESAMSVPIEAVCQRGEQEYVFCVRDGLAIACPVETGYLLSTSVEIRRGIETEDKVILSPPDTLTDGDRVEVMV